MGKDVVYSVPLETLIEEFQLYIFYLPENEKIMVTRNEVNRPGLALSGFFGHFEAGRIQIFGKSEYEYLNNMTPEERRQCSAAFFAMHPVAIVFSSDLKVFPEVLEEAKNKRVPVFGTSLPTSEFMAALIGSLNIHLAPRITRHGVLVEVYGEGLLIIGDSGIGKSETAIELVKRGHRLIADDAVEIKKVSNKTLIGAAPELIRYFIELRGIGIVDVRRLFGIGSVKDMEKIDHVIQLEPWVEGKEYDRFGLDSETVDIMGIKIPMTLIPVRPGRNLAIIIEIAAMNNRQKKMGYNTAEEFNKKLMSQIEGESHT